MVQVAVATYGRGEGWREKIEEHKKIMKEDWLIYIFQKPQNNMG